MIFAAILRAAILQSFLADACLQRAFYEPDTNFERVSKVCPIAPLEQELTLFQYPMHALHQTTSGSTNFERMAGTTLWSQVVKRHVRFGAYELTTELGGMSDLGRKIMVCICFVSPAMLVLYGLAVFCCGQGAQGSREGAAHLPLHLRATVRSIQAFLYVFGLLFTGTLSVVIPDSYELALDVGQGSVFSGLLIGAPTAFAVFSMLAARRLMDPWSQRFVRNFCFGGVVFASLLALAFALGANPPSDWHLGNRPRMVIIMASRLAMGLLVSAVGPMLRIMAQKVTPAREWMMLNVHRVTFVPVGIGSGPLLATVIKHVMGASGIRERAAWPLLAMSLMWAALALSFYLVMPTSIDDLVGVNEKVDPSPVLEDTPTRVPGIAPTDITTEAFVGLRKDVWTLALIYGMERALVVAALEASTSLILQLEFGCNTFDIGLMIGTSFLLGAPVTVFMTIVRRRGFLSDTAALAGCATMCLAATVLFLLGQNMWFFLIADTIIFPSGYLANGIVDGFSTQYAMEDTFFNQRNAAVLGKILQDTAGRFIGPPVARFIAHLGGRRLYAQVQIAMCTISFVTAWKLRSAILKIHKHSSEPATKP